jgi:hypothetical protein
MIGSRPTSELRRGGDRPLACSLVILRLGERAALHLSTSAAALVLAGSIVPWITFSRPARS